MDTITYSTARKIFATTMQRVCQDHAPIIITRKNADPVIMMSLEDYNAIEETGYLLRNPANADRLRASIHQYEQGQYFERKEIIKSTKLGAIRQELSNDINKKRKSSKSVD